MLSTFALLLLAASLRSTRLAYMADTETCTDCLPEASTSAAPAQPVASTSSSAVLDPATFSPPAVQQHELPRIEIEFCDRCRWLHRAVWTQTELFLTFPPTPTSGLKAITLLPRSAPETGGRFRVWLYRNRTIEEEYEQNCPDSWGEAELVWDRKVTLGPSAMMKRPNSLFDRLREAFPSSRY